MQEPMLRLVVAETGRRRAHVEVGDLVVAEPEVQEPMLRLVVAETGCRRAHVEVGDLVVAEPEVDKPMLSHVEVGDVVAAELQEEELLPWRSILCFCLCLSRPDGFG